MSPWCTQAMKDQLLPEVLGVALPCLRRSMWRGPEKTRPTPNKATHSAWGVFLAKHDSSSVSKVASGECSLHQCEMQNDLIQAAASVWIGTITSDIRRSAFFLVMASGKQELFSVCFLCQWSTTGARCFSSVSRISDHKLCISSNWLCLCAAEEFFFFPLIFFHH